jgi:hypothetical protein
VTQATDRESRAESGFRGGPGRGRGRGGFAARNFAAAGLTTKGGAPARQNGSTDSPNSGDA